MNRERPAAAPPMGWNSWDCYGASVTEEELLGNAEYMAEKLRPFGWEYVVCDIQWSEPTADSSQYHPFADLAMDGFGRLVPAENRFPSAGGGKGFSEIADRIHRMGLKFGIHIMRGIPRQAVFLNTPVKGTNFHARDIAKTFSICEWNTDMYGVDSRKPGAQEYYDSLFELYADWKVDFVKADDIAWSAIPENGSHCIRDEIAMIRKAIGRCGRNMVLSLSPGPAEIENGDFYAEYADMWRITGDFWDNWASLRDMFGRCRSWNRYAGGGHWPDCDMLPLGRIGIRGGEGQLTEPRNTLFTKDEQMTMMSLWSVFRSPLMFGGELRDSDAWTLSLLTNRALLDIDQNSGPAEEIRNSDGFIVWRTAVGSGKAAAVFNVSDNSAVFGAGCVGIAGKDAENVWTGARGKIPEKICVPPHGVKMYRMEE